MISHRYHCLFIHIPKCAGTSIEKKLGHFTEQRRGVQDHRTLRDYEPVSPAVFLRLLRSGDPYMTWRRHCRRFVWEAAGLAGPLTRAQFQHYFKFTFVRNPWARVHSWYQNVLRDSHHQRRLGLSADVDFDAFLQRCPDLYETHPQTWWLQDSRGALAMDFIGRFENLKEDFAQVAERIGLEDAELPWLVKGGGGESYTEAYSDEGRARVAQVYAEEIEQFGYRFGE